VLIGCIEGHSKMRGMKSYLRYWINASRRSLLVFAQRETLYIRELDFVRAEGFSATHCQQRWVEKVDEMHVAHDRSEDRQQRQLRHLK
jgi:hypothetical protein